MFDEHEQLGGMMRYGIPGFRTPRKVLDAEIQRILDLGVETRLSTRIGTDVTLEQLRKDYDAVFLGLGAQGGRPLPAPGAEAPNCVTATAFLHAFNDGRMQHGRQARGGGRRRRHFDRRRHGGAAPRAHRARARDRPSGVGNRWASMAQDVAEISAHQGAEVTLTSVFAIDKMQANKHEIEHALAEGIVIRGGWAPVEVVRDASGRATALRVAKCEAKFVGPKLEIKMNEGTEEDDPRRPDRLRDRPGGRLHRAGGLRQRQGR